MLRRATKQDLNELVNLEQAVYGPSGFNIYYFRQMLDLFPSLFWVYDCGEGQLAGYALGAIGRREQEAGADEGWVLSLLVGEGFRGQGLAKQLMNALLSGFKGHECQQILLTVSEQNLSAVGLYRQLGFVDKAIEPEYYGPEQPRLVMMLKYQ